MESLAAAPWLNRKLILILGKGGVGKSTLAEAAARQLAAQGKRVYLAQVLQADDSARSEPKQLAPGLFTQTLSAEQCFREYIGLKLKLRTLTSLFLSSKIIDYLYKASPGIREIVLLGKVWHERENYDHVVVDMPSTGYGLAMIHAPHNFARLFPGGPVYHDAVDMMRTVGEPDETALVTVTLAEEMPLQESEELAQELRNVAPLNKPWLVVNRLLELPPDLARRGRDKQEALRALAAKNALAAAGTHLLDRHLCQRENLRRFNAGAFAHRLDIAEGALS